jgi:hypothetical protein
VIAIRLNAVAGYAVGAPASPASADGRSVLAAAPNAGELSSYWTKGSASSRFPLGGVTVRGFITRPRGERGHLRNFRVFV